MGKQKYIFICLGILVFAMIFGYVSLKNRILKARFTLYAFGYYLESYERIEGKRIQSLSKLPDFHLVSYPHSLSLKASDLRSRIIDGYLYDFQRTGQGGFAMSASPLKLHPLAVEFGITDDWNLRVNTEGVDTRSDSYDEIKSWPILPEQFELQTLSERS